MLIEVVLREGETTTLLARFPPTELGDVSEHAMHKKACSHHLVKAALSSMSAWGKGDLVVTCDGQVIGEPIPNTTHYAEVRAVLPNGKTTGILAGESSNDPDRLKAWCAHIAQAMFSEMRDPCQVKVAVHSRAARMSWYHTYKEAPHVSL